MLPQLDPTWYASQSVWMILTYCALFLIMWKIVLPVMSAVIEGRQHRLDDDIKKAEEFKNEASRVLKEYQNAMASAGEKVRFKLAEAQKETAEELKKQDDAFSERLNQKVSEGEQKVLDAKKTALSDVKSISAGLISDITQKLADIQVPVQAAEKEVSAEMEKWL